MVFAIGVMMGRAMVTPVVMPMMAPVMVTIAPIVCPAAAGDEFKEEHDQEAEEEEAEETADDPEGVPAPPVNPVATCCQIGRGGNRSITITPTTQLSHEVALVPSRLPDTTADCAKAQYGHHDCNGQRGQRPPVHLLDSFKHISSSCT